MSGIGIAVVGAGGIGRLHAERLSSRPGEAYLAALVDPSPAARTFAETLGVACHSDLDALFRADAPDAAIVATPNDTHLALASALLERGVPVIVEKPIASTIQDARAIAEIAKATGVPVLVGHHRRHNPILRAARDFLLEERIGRLVNVNVMANFLKPDPYFDLAWRRKMGAGPVLSNMIHEIDVIRFLCGEIATVQALTSNATRGFEVEDSAAALIRMKSGALVTIALSDTTAAPWHWDLIARENVAYPEQPQPENAHFFSGTLGALSLPKLDWWRYEGPRGWYERLSVTTVPKAAGDPYIEQILHFCRVIRGEEAPIIDADDATRTLVATLAVHESARSGTIQHLA